MTPTARAAVAAVAGVWKQPEAGIIGKTRYRRLTVPRFFAWLLMHEAGFSMPRIGADFDRDHTTIFHGINRAREMAKEDHWREHWQSAQTAFVAAQEEQRVRALPKFYRHGQLGGNKP